MAWRLLIFVIAFFALVLGFSTIATLIAFAVGAAFGLIEAASPDALASSPIILAASALASLPATLLATWLIGHFIDRRKVFPDFGLQIDLNWLIDLGFGLALGALLMALIFGVEVVLGWVEVTATLVGSPGFSFPVAFVGQLIVFLCVGIYEEVLFRGYALVNLSEGFRGLGAVPGILLAFVGSAIAFGLGHAGNPNATLLSTVNISLASFMLGIAMLLTGKLAIPIGLHITWNFFQGAVFGFPVSGLGSVGSVVVIEQGGPTLLTGGPFGPEAGLIGLAAMAVGIGLTVGYVYLRYGEVGIHMGLAEPTLRPRKKDGPTPEAVS